jgi:hypothetical protein
VPAGQNFNNSQSIPDEWNDLFFAQGVPQEQCLTIKILRSGLMSDIPVRAHTVVGERRKCARLALKQPLLTAH